MPDRFSVDHLFLAKGQRSQRFREQLHAVDTDGRLAGLGAEERTVYADDVPEIEMGKHRECAFPQLVLPEIELDFAGRICEMSESSLAVRAPGDYPPRYRHRRSCVAIPHHGQCSFRCLLSIETVRVRSYAGRLQGCQFLASRLENEVQVFGHAAAVVDSPVCFRYASMKGSIAPSITFCTSGILSSVRWSLTMVYGWNT